MHRQTSALSRRHCQYYRFCRLCRHCRRRPLCARRGRNHIPLIQRPPVCGVSGPRPCRLMWRRSRRIMGPKMPCILSRLLRAAGPRLHRSNHMTTCSLAPPASAGSVHRRRQRRCGWRPWRAACVARGSSEGYGAEVDEGVAAGAAGGGARTVPGGRLSDATLRRLSPGCQFPSP